MVFFINVQILSCVDVECFIMKGIIFVICIVVDKIFNVVGVVLLEDIGDDLKGFFWIKVVGVVDISFD